MLSEGRPGIDNLYMLRNGMQSLIRSHLLFTLLCFAKWLLRYLIGVLRMELSKEKYERCGLSGQPICDGGRKHIKARYGECVSGPLMKGIW